MTLLLATLVLAQTASQGPILTPGGEDPVQVFVRPRAGLWASNGFQFQAVRTDSVRVDTNEKILYSGGVDGGVRIMDNFVVWASAELSGTDVISSRLAGVYVGFRDRAGPDAAPGIPHEATAYVGALWGTFEVDEPGFGDFKSAFGFAAGLELGWAMNRSLTLQLIGEYRFIEFEYKEPVLMGDEEAGRSTGWAGIGVDIRF